MFVIHHLEKTGGSTVEKSISPYLEIYDLYIRDWQIFLFSPNDGLNEHCGSGATKKFLGDHWNKFKKFSTVRDPVGIMKSMYNYANNALDNMPKGEIPPEGALSIAQNCRMRGLGPDSFVNLMLDSGYLMVAPQTERLFHIINDGLIVDMQDLDLRWKEITDYLGFTQIPMVNYNVLGSDHIIFSNKTINKIKKHFEKDYDVLPQITGSVW